MKNCTLNNPHQKTRPQGRAIFLTIILVAVLLLPVTGRTARALNSEDEHRIDAFTTSLWQTAYQGPVYWDDMPQNAALVGDAGQVKSAVPGPDDPVNMIVQLSYPAAAQTFLENTRGKISMEEILSTEAKQISSQQSAFLSDLHAQDVNFQVKASQAFLVNTLVLNIKPNDINIVKDDPRVLGAWPDYEMTMAVDESVPLIGAPTVWDLSSPAGIPITGQGIVIAVVDTGIDYTHPDLGGCLGTGCKVVGGYDFVNEDHDPIDDHGHGTHVAGIAAANGTRVGVAPDAALLAYKVLDANGTGQVSDMINALEAAVLAGANVVNFSLSGPGTTEDALSQAITQATDLGVVVVAAAGNAGDRYGTIQSPGLVPDALTVGATTKTDLIAAFSSRGPVGSISVTLKPDLIAPGVNITSSVPTTGPLGHASGYRSLSGTSMAAPHAAGAAALIKQYRTSWSARMIKSILKQLTTDLGLNPYIQGNGRLDISGLSNLDLIVDTMHLDFGIDDLSQNLWLGSQSMNITNISGEKIDLAIHLGEAFSTGISLSFTPETFSLDPFEQQTITFSLSVNNTRVPNVDSPPHSYLNAILIETDKATLPIPVVFIKMPTLSITSLDDVWVMAVHNRSDRMETRNFNNNPVFFLPEGRYDLVILFMNGKTRVIRENIDLQSFQEIIISAADAGNTLQLTVTDIQNQPLPLDGTTYDFTMPTGLYFKGTTYGIFTLGRLCLDKDICDHLKISDFSSDYRFEISIPQRSEATGQAYYRFFHTIEEGLTTDILFSNSAADLTPLLHHFKPLPGDLALTIIRWIGTRHILSASSTWQQQLSPPHELQAYSMVIPADAMLAPETISIYSGDESPIIRFPGDYQLPIFYNGCLYAITEDTAPLLCSDQPTMKNGLGFPHWSGSLSLDEETLNVFPKIGSTGFFPFQWLDFRGQANLPFTLFNEMGNLLESGNLMQTNNLELPTHGPYQLDVSYSDYRIGVQPGTVSASLKFDTQQTDFNPPTITAAVVIQDNAFTDTLFPDSPGFLFLTLADENTIPLIQVEADLGSGWQNLALIGTNHTYQIELPDLDPYQYMSLRITAEDDQGNQLVFTAMPALLGKGNYLQHFPLVEQ